MIMAICCLRLTSGIEAVPEPAGGLVDLGIYLSRSLGDLARGWRYADQVMDDCQERLG